MTPEQIKAYVDKGEQLSKGMVDLLATVPCRNPHELMGIFGMAITRVLTSVAQTPDFTDEEIRSLVEAIKGDTLNKMEALSGCKKN